MAAVANPDDWIAISEAVNIYKKEEIIMHFSRLQTKIKDAEILKAALRDMGITVKIDADVRGYNGQRVRADIVGVLTGEYDIGWSRNADGRFDFIADLWGVAKKSNHAQLILGICNKYAINKTLAESKRRGIVGKSECPRCSSTQINKHGYSMGKQNYICRDCGTQFVE